MSTNPSYIAAAERTAAFVPVSGQFFSQPMWPNTVKPSSHRGGGAADAALTDATIGLARRPRRIPL
jgi:hypothetical protein